MASKKSGKKKSPDAPRARGGFKTSRHGDGKGKASAAGNKSEQKRAAEHRERSGAAHTSHEGSKWLQGGRIEPRRIDGTESAADLIDTTFLAYNAARLREACQLYTRKMLEPDVTVGLTLTGAKTKRQLVHRGFQRERPFDVAGRAKRHRRTSIDVDRGLLRLDIRAAVQ